MRTTSGLTTWRWRSPIFERFGPGLPGSPNFRYHTHRSPRRTPVTTSTPERPDDIAIELFVIKAEFANAVLGVDLGIGAAGTHQ